MQDEVVKVLKRSLEGHDVSAKAEHITPLPQCSAQFSAIKVCPIVLFFNFNFPIRMTGLLLVSALPSNANLCAAVDGTIARVSTGIRLWPVLEYVSCLWRCGGGVVVWWWWCGGVVVWWCGGVVVW